MRRGLEHVRTPGCAVPAEGGRGGGNGAGGVLGDAADAVQVLEGYAAEVDAAELEDAHRDVGSGSHAGHLGARTLGVAVGDDPVATGVLAEDRVVDLDDQVDSGGVL